RPLDGGRLPARAIPGGRPHAELPEHAEGLRRVASGRRLEDEALRAVSEPARPAGSSRRRPDEALRQGWVLKVRRPQGPRLPDQGMDAAPAIARNSRLRSGRRPRVRGAWRRTLIDQRREYRG